MSLSDRLSVPSEPPARRDRQAMPTGVKYEGGVPVEATLSSREVPQDESEWRELIKLHTGITIRESELVELAEVRVWQMNGHENYWCKFRLTPLGGTPEIDIEDLLKAAKAARRLKGADKPTTDKGLVVAWADLQVGGVGSRGGTEELLERVEEKLASLERYIDKLKPASVHLIDVGDCVESFENVPSQAFTNDLSFPEQLRVARRIFMDAVLRIARRTPELTCASVPSNHGQWRRGKDQLGRAGDDFGLETLTAVADACAVNPEQLGHVKFHLPTVWEESIALDVQGAILGVVHGHQVNNPDRIPQWWANQTHGAQPVSDADVLLTGHFHHLRIQPSGRSPHTGRSRWWIGAPTLDNGSDWWRYKAGSDSDPGLLTFTLNATDGWSDLHVF